MRPEKKYLDTTYIGSFDQTGEVLPGGGTSTGLNLIPQGDTAVTRDGRECYIRSIHLRGYVNLPLNAGISSCVIRMMLVLDTQANGAYPAFADVVNGVNGFNNLDNSKRFRILKDWFFAVNSMNLALTAADVLTSTSIYKYIKYNKRCNIPLEFSGTTGAITEVRSNNLVLIAAAAPTDDTVNFAMITRIRFMG